MGFVHFTIHKKNIVFLLWIYILPSIIPLLSILILDLASAPNREYFFNSNSDKTMQNCLLLISIMLFLAFLKVF